MAPATREADGVTDSALELSGQLRRRYSDPFEQIWLEIRKWPGFSPQTMSKPEAFQAFEEVEAELPPTDDVVAAARAYGRFLERENARRPPSDPRRVINPANWFRRKRWASDDGSTPLADEPTRPTTISKEDVDSLRAAGLSNDLITTWFADGEYDAGPPPVFRAATRFKADCIVQRYGSLLERAFGAPVIVTAKQAAAG